MNKLKLSFWVCGLMQYEHGNEHIQMIQTKCKRIINVMRCLRGSEGEERVELQ